MVNHKLVYGVMALHGANTFLVTLVKKRCDGFKLIDKYFQCFD